MRFLYNLTSLCVKKQYVSKSKMKKGGFIGTPTAVGIVVLIGISLFVLATIFYIIVLIINWMYQGVKGVSKKVQKALKKKPLPLSQQPPPQPDVMIQESTKIVNELSITVDKTVEKGFFSGLKSKLSTIVNFVPRLMLTFGVKSKYGELDIHAETLQKLDKKEDDDDIMDTLEIMDDVHLYPNILNTMLPHVPLKLQSYYYLKPDDKEQNDYLVIADLILHLHALNKIRNGEYIDFSTDNGPISIILKWLIVNELPDEAGVASLIHGIKDLHAMFSGLEPIDENEKIATIVDLSKHMHVLKDKIDLLPLKESWFKSKTELQIKRKKQKSAMIELMTKAFDVWLCRLNEKDKCKYKFNLNTTQKLDELPFKQSTPDSFIESKKNLMTFKVAATAVVAAVNFSSIIPKKNECKNGIRVMVQSSNKKYCVSTQKQNNTAKTVRLNGKEVYVRESRGGARRKTLKTKHL